MLLIAKSVLEVYVRFVKPAKKNIKTKSYKFEVFIFITEKRVLHVKYLITLLYAVKKK